MKTIVAILLFAGTAMLAQSQSMPEPGGAYPLVLTVISAQRSARGGEMTTHIVGISVGRSAANATAHGV